MNEENLIKYYNKFNEEKRLLRRHGIIEFETIIYYLNQYLKKNDTILDIGAGSGKYSIYLDNLGYDVTAIELIKHNLMKIKKEKSNIKVFQGNAINLDKFIDNSFDIVLLFGPMYHLITHEEKLKALNEAKRLVKDNGLIFTQYIMNDYAILKHGFIDNNFLAKKNKVNVNYQILSDKNDLYSYVRLNEIDLLNKEANLKLLNRITPDGLTDFFRKEINNMSEELFTEYLNYNIFMSNKKEIFGFSTHILDILKKN